MTGKINKQVLPIVRPLLTTLFLLDDPPADIPVPVGARPLPSSVVEIIVRIPENSDGSGVDFGLSMRPTA